MKGMTAKMKEPFVSRMLKLSLYVILASGTLGVITLPFMLEKYMGLLYDAYYLEPGYRVFILIFLTLVAVPILWIILELIWMLNSVPRDPFVMRNVHALNRIGMIFLVLSALFFIKCLRYVTFLTMGCGLLFIIGGLFAFTLSSLFRQAVAFKEENDLTI